MILSRCNRVVKAQRRDVRCAANLPENRPIFQIMPNMNCATLDDIEDALIMCKSSSLDHAKDMCFSLGIDYVNAMKYYPTVRYLENCYRHDANWSSRVVSWNLFVLSQFVEAAYHGMIGGMVGAKKN